MPACKTICTAGQLKRRIEIQSAVTTQDDFGAEIETWKQDAVVWARIQPVQGKEFESADQITAEVTHKIMIRYFAGLSTKQRIKYGTRVFDINFVRNVFEDNRWHELLCREDVR